ncbi:hypothetical protein C2W62_47885 [Candidatus Entotheonella serta]|nr:hypothetical protein C2W62_47885 [Candidatus Entotheonella serta]
MPSPTVVSTVIAPPWLVIIACTSANPIPVPSPTDLVEESQGFICVHDPDGTLLSVNPAAANALGYSVDELIGSPKPVA